MRPVEEQSDQELKNIIANHRRRERTGESVYLAALAEEARRKGNGLDFGKTFALVRKAAAANRFLGYKELADESGADWSKVHYSVNGHLGKLMEYAHRRGWPLLPAVVVNKKNVETGEMEPSMLKGFVTAAKALGYSVIDEEAFLREQQRRVFAWAASLLPESPSTQLPADASLPRTASRWSEAGGETLA
ncbi:hypothetical protein [Mangrovibrevibacter kandeliae]|uniref:hypothetical protein n=1 Tax=Mangrovibrevibacter kandeliae TaxID=2968473 RepID=UPI002117346D|nr:hypothetical protein [Aurantimonas sp. CSK15Z-1]MCQ8783540.1 hypothetical protein [Aurantimonas sp. CSK15Z-1]